MRDNEIRRKRHKFSTILIVLSVISFIVLFGVILIMGIKLQSWLSKEDYRSEYKPNINFVVLVDIPNEKNNKVFSTTTWSWTPSEIEDLNKRFPEWKLHYSIKADLINYELSRKFIYKRKEINRDRIRITISHWIKDDAIWKNIYDIENNKVFPVSFQTESTISYMMIGFLPSLIIALIITVLLKKILDQKLHNLEDKKKEK